MFLMEFGKGCTLLIRIQKKDAKILKEENEF
jgi:hypothetical protein